MINFVSDLQQVAGVDQGFQVSGGALKKIAPSGGRRENFWDISCEKSRFYAKKSYILGRRVPGAPPPPLDPPLGWWFSLGTAVSSTNKTDRHDITEIVLKVALNTITLTLTLPLCFGGVYV